MIDSVRSTAVYAGGLVLPPGRRLTEGERRTLRMPNPEWASWSRLRKRYPKMAQPPKWLDAWRPLPPPHPWTGAVLLPRQAPELAGVGYVDRTSCPPAATLELQLEPRPYQAAAREAWEAGGRQGVLQAPCGAGKTVIGQDCIARAPTPALVLVHTLDLARQWQDRLRSQLGVEASLVGGGVAQAPGRVTIATFQTLATRDFWKRHRWGASFGLVVVDEAHHVPADTFADVMLSLPARWRLSLTATPDRPDGLSQLLWWHMGGLVYQIDQAQLTRAGVLMPPQVRFLATGWSPPRKAAWQDLLTAACEDAGRNELLLEVLDDLVGEGRQVLVLTKRVAHARGIAEAVRQLGHRSHQLTGQLSKKVRAKILAQAAAQDLDVITATTVADEGLDLPRLDALVLTMPTKPGGRLEQRVGRVMRSAEDKRTPVVVDLVDVGLEGLAHGRARLYRRLGADVAQVPTRHPSRRSA